MLHKIKIRISKEFFESFFNLFPTITLSGKKEVVNLQIEENESGKYWLGILNDLKNRGVKDIMLICADGLTGIKEAISAAFPNTEYQRCIVHQVRNTLRYISSDH